MFEGVKKFAEDNHLPLKFVGFIPMEELIALYQSCSVYVAAGRSEPWGMRLNDALNCGAPLVVSRGMGGVKLVDDFYCGLTFAANDYVDLAHKLRRMALDQELYCRCATAAMKAVNEISPEKKAKELIAMIRGVCPDWI
jgi:glycosyltransferase involved in cell wall biosynthesis